MYYLTSLLAFAALVAAQADPSIATPAAIVQCQPAQISFTATKTPVFISIIPGGQPSAAPLQDLGQQNASPFTWVASIAANTQITFQIRDSTGAVAYSAPVTIQSSSDSSCLGGNVSTTGAASGSATASQVSQSSAVASASSSSVAVSSSVAEVSSSIAASASSAVSSALSSATAPATTSRASASSASTSSRSATATSAATSPSTTPNSARSNMQVGFAGLIGLAAAAVLA